MTEPRIKITMLNVEREYRWLALDIVDRYLHEYASPERETQYHGVGYGAGSPRFYAWGDEKHVRIKQTS